MPTNISTNQNTLCQTWYKSSKEYCHKNQIIFLYIPNGPENMFDLFNIVLKVLLKSIMISMLWWFLSDRGAKVSMGRFKENKC